MGLFSSHLLSSRFCLSSKTWAWRNDPSMNFTVKSLLADLVGTIDPLLKDLYIVIWKDHYPKKTKIFQWELVLWRC